MNYESGLAMRAVLEEARASPWPENRHTHTHVQDTHGQGLPGGE
jgi:hypothetical protein